MDDTAREAAARVAAAFARPEPLAAAERDEALARIADPDVSGRQLADLESSHSADVRAGVAAHPRTPTRVLWRLAMSEQGAVRSAALKNPGLPDRVANDALRIFGHTVAPDLARNSSLGVRVRMQVGAYKESWKAYASDPTAPPGVLNKIVDAAETGKESRSSRKEREAKRRVNIAVRNASGAAVAVPLLGAVADNPNTPASTLRKLAKADDIAVREGVAGNPNTPDDVFERFLSDSERVRVAMLANPGCPEHVRAAAAFLS